MFGAAGSLWSNFVTSENLLEKERNPPPRPTPLEFPNYKPSSCNHQLTTHHMVVLETDLLSLRRPSEIPDSLLANLNIQMDQDVPLSKFVPENEFPTRPYLHDQELESMLKEISVENEDAFREVLKQSPRPGKERAKLVYSRPFYTCLEDMARYWDISADQYYEIEVDDDDDEKVEVRNGVENTGKGDADMLRTDGDLKTGKQNEKPQPAEASKVTTQHNESRTEKRRKEVYKGQRIANGEQMPPGLRAAAVRNLLKMVVYKFGCRDYDMNPREKLRIRNINLPMVQYTFAIVKNPSEMKLAKARIVEGPMMAVYTRSDTRFKLTEKDQQRSKIKKKESLREGLTSPEKGGKTSVLSGLASGMGSTNSNAANEPFGETFDFCREIGCLLQVAMQRNREGRNKETELTTATESQWWANKPRWGGGPTRWGQMAHEIYEDEDPSWSPIEYNLQMEKRERDREQREQEQERIRKQKEEDDASMKSTVLTTPGSGSSLAIFSPTPPNWKSRSKSNSSSSSSSTTSSETTNDEDITTGSMTDRPKKKKRSGSHHGIFDDGNNDKSNDIGEDNKNKKPIQVQSMRKRWYQEWAKLRPNTFIWDEKVIWKRIGSKFDQQSFVKDGDDNKRGSLRDEVYLLSSVNHHVCLMKLNVSKFYLDWLEGSNNHDDLPDGNDDINMDGNDEKDNDDKAILKVYRSKWYDFFSIEDRKELLIGLWRIMSYLNS